LSRILLAFYEVANRKSPDLLFDSIGINGVAKRSKSRMAVALQNLDAVGVVNVSSETDGATVD
jgi:hypothetical protein